MLPSVDSRLACLVILLLISTASPVSVLLWIVLRSFFPPASTETEREREIVCQSGYQDVSGRVMKDTFLHIAQHTAQMWQLMCCWSRRCPLHMMQGDWLDGLRRCTEPELGMTWPNSSTCVSILWVEQFTTVIKKKCMLNAITIILTFEQVMCVMFSMLKYFFSLTCYK